MISFSDNDLFLVTGASGGIGRAVSEKIITLGGKVVGIGRNAAKLNEITEKLGANFISEIRDLADEMSSIPDWLYELSQRYGKFRGLVLSAGVQDTRPLSILKEENIDDIFDINFKSNMFMIKAFAKKRVRLEGRCSCVAISSIVADFGIPAISAYSASKGALNSAVKSLSIELAKDDIRINAVSPGHIETEMLSEGSKFFSEEYLNKLKANYPLGLGKCEDVANLVCFLLSDASNWITGANYNIDGGAATAFFNK